MFKILAIDDSPTIRTKLQIYLSQAGHEVMVLDKFIDLPKILRNSHFDVIIMDLQMAVPGEKMGDMIRATCPKTPVIIYSSEKEERLKAAKEKIHAFAAVSKMDDFSCLLEAIDKAFHCSKFLGNLQPHDQTVS